MDMMEILDKVMVDDLYYKATGGGIAFGGGEPLLRSDGIVDFCKSRPKEWRIYIETSLNVERRSLEAVAPYIDYYYIDVKDMNPDIYRRYTGRSNHRVVSNLRWLASNVDVGKVTIRLPHIPDYNTAQDVERSQRQLEAMGFRVFDRFWYIMPNAG
jgi:pyruvate formate lyase activating enzyme